MGCCSDDVHAEKKPDEHCDCPQHFWRSTRIALGELTLDTFFNHRYVEVIFKCDNCHKRFFYTYDLVEDGDGTKRKLNRRYTTKYQELKTCYKELSYIDEHFFQMRSDFGTISHNCRDWADRFYYLLAN